jgi:serine/threonine protein kinase
MQLKQTLGKGGHGKIVEVGPKAVCKIMKKSPVAYKEIYTTEKLQTLEGIVKLLHVEEDADNLYMYMEKLQPITIVSDIKEHLRKSLLIIHNLHQNNVIHNDIKPDNIMKDDKENYKLIDFGCSLDGNKDIPKLTYTTPLFCSVESLSSKTCYKSDVWALGIIAYHYYTDVFPFDGQHIHEVFRSILSKNVDYSKIADPQASMFVRALLDKDTEKRLTAIEALHHNFLL